LAKPDATNTGASGIRTSSKVKALVKRESKLQNATLAAALTVSGDGSVVRNVSVDGPIIVTGDHVTLDHVTAKRVMVLGASYLTLRRSNLSGGGTAVHVTSNTEQGQKVREVKLIANYIHDPASAARDSYSGTRLRGAVGVTISCSNYALGAYGRAALLMEDVNGGTTKVTVTKNWLDGGGFTVVTDAKRVALRSNTFGRSATYGTCHAASGVPIRQSRNRTSDGSPLQPCPSSPRWPTNNSSASPSARPSPPARTATSATPTRMATAKATLPAAVQTSTAPTTRPSATASSTFKPGATTSSPKPAPPTSAAVPRNSVNIKDYGAACDGVKDDRVAIRNAIDAVADRGGGIVNIPSGSCRQLQTAASLFTGVGANVTIRGVGPTSKLLLACDARDSYRALYRISGDNVTFENLSIVRATACSGAMIALRPFANTTLHNVIIDGQYQLGGGSMHALLQAHATSGTYRNIRLIGTSIKNMTSYGFLQPNSATTSTDGILVDGSTFTNNGNDDLEFNAPNGTMKNVTVKNSSFSDNRNAARTHGGFGIGLANVQNALLTNNTFEDYNYEPIHIENGTAHVTIEDSSFKNAFTASRSWASHVAIISGSHDITIQRNTFDTSSNTNTITPILISTGGSYAEPYNIKISSNTFIIRANAKTTYYSGISGVTMSGNTVKNIP